MFNSVPKTKIYIGDESSIAIELYFRWLAFSNELFWIEKRPDIELIEQSYFDGSGTSCFLFDEEGNLIFSTTSSTTTWRIERTEKNEIFRLTMEQKNKYSGQNEKWESLIRIDSTKNKIFRTVIFPEKRAEELIAFYEQDKNGSIVKLSAEIDVLLISPTGVLSESSTRMCEISEKCGQTDTRLLERDNHKNLIKRTFTNVDEKRIEETFGLEKNERNDWTRRWAIDNPNMNPVNSKHSEIRFIEYRR